MSPDTPRQLNTRASHGNVLADDNIGKLTLLQLVSTIAFSNSFLQRVNNRYFACVPPPPPSPTVRKNKVANAQP